ncbi:hypothetical protein E2055_00430 [Escherichia coli]|nr:hypothetical protein [Escherichia coli]
MVRATSRPAFTLILPVAVTDDATAVISRPAVEEWIIDRQKQSAALTDLMDQYVLLAYRTTVDDNRN